MSLDKVDRELLSDLDLVVKKFEKLIQEMCWRGKAIGRSFMTGEEARLLQLLKEIAGIGDDVREPSEILYRICAEVDKNKVYLQHLKKYVKGWIYKFNRAQSCRKA